MGWDWAISLMRYGERWRSHRRALHKKFHAVAVAEYHPIQVKHTRFIYPSVLSDGYLTIPSVLLQRLYGTPHDYLAHLRHTSGAIIMAACYWIHHLNRTFF